MARKEVNIPPAFYELHGERARLSSIIIVYLTGIVTTSMLTLHLLPARLNVWKYILVGIIVLDIAGGVVANLSSSTNQYYQHRKSLRIPFLCLHILQPLGLYVVFPLHLDYFAFLFGYTFALSLVLNFIEDCENQQNLAAAFVVMGTIGSIYFHVDYVVLYLVGVMYMTKLMLGFSVRRPAFI